MYAYDTDAPGSISMGRAFFWQIEEDNSENGKRIKSALTTILAILFQYCYKYCYSDSRNL
jgi:hypothetical protein